MVEEWNRSTRLRCLETVMAGGSGMMREFSRGKSRASKVPPGSRPVVTPTASISRATAMRSTKRAGGTAQDSPKA